MLRECCHFTSDWTKGACWASLCYRLKSVKLKEFRHWNEISASRSNQSRIGRIRLFACKKERLHQRPNRTYINVMNFSNTQKTSGSDILSTSCCVFQPMFLFGQDKVLCTAATTAMASSGHSLGGVHSFPLHGGLESTAGVLGGMMGWLDDGVSSWGTGGWRLTWVCLFVAFFLRVA